MHNPKLETESSRVHWDCDVCREVDGSRQSEALSLRWAKAPAVAVQDDDCKNAGVLPIAAGGAIGSSLHQGNKYVLR